jgi:hypothetical protein
MLRSHRQSGSDRLAERPILIATKYMLFRGQDTSSLRRDERAARDL